MKPEIQIADFLKYNAPALNEMKNESPEIAAAFAQVIKELAQKYGNIGPVTTAQSSKPSFSKWDYMSLTGSVYYYDGKVYFIKQVKFKEGFLPGEFSTIITLKEFVRGKKPGKEQDLLLTNHYEAFYALSAFRLYDTEEDEQNQSSKYKFLNKRNSLHTTLKQYFYINLQEISTAGNVMKLHYEGKTITDDLCLFRFSQIVDNKVIEDKIYMSADQCVQMICNNDFTLNVPTKILNLPVRPLNYWLSVLLKFEYVEFNSKTDLIGLMYQRWATSGTISQIIKNNPKNKTIEITDAQGDTTAARIDLDDIISGIKKVSSTNATSIRPPGENNQFIGEKARFMTRCELESRYLTDGLGFQIMRGRQEISSLLAEIKNLGITIEEVLSFIENTTIDELGKQNVLFVDYGGELKPAKGELLLQGYHLILKLGEHSIVLRQSVCYNLTTIEDPIPTEMLRNYQIQYEIDETRLDPKGGFAKRSLINNMLTVAETEKSLLYEAYLIKNINLQEQLITYEYQTEGRNVPFKEGTLTFDAYMKMYLYLDYNTFISEAIPVYNVGEKYPIVTTTNTTEMCEITLRMLGSNDWEYSYTSVSNIQREGVTNFYLKRFYNPNYIAPGDKIQISEIFIKEHQAAYQKIKDSGLDFYTIKTIEVSSWAGVAVRVEIAPDTVIDLNRVDGLYLKDLERY